MKTTIGRKIFLWYALVILPPCTTVIEWASASIDKGKLPLHKRILFTLHLQICEWCRRYVSQVEVLQKEVRVTSKQVEESGEGTLSYSAKERMKKTLHD